MDFRPLKSGRFFPVFSKLLKSKRSFKRLLSPISRHRLAPYSPTRGDSHFQSPIAEKLAHFDKTPTEFDRGVFASLLII